MGHLTRPAVFSSICLLRTESLQHKQAIYNIYCSMNQLQPRSDTPLNRTPAIQPFIYLLEMTVKRSHPHSAFFSVFPGRARNVTGSQQVPGEHFSQLCKHAFVLMGLFFYCLFDDTVRFSDQGRRRRGQQR